MLTTAVTSTIRKHGAYDRNAEWPPLASRHLSKSALPGESGRVIPFGRYHLAVHRQGRPQSEWPHRAMLVNGDDGARIVRSARQLNALAQDPDVEIY